MKTTKGFTLIELLVVIAIIAVLATGAVAVYTSAQQKARDSVRMADLNVLNGASAVYYADNTSYPVNNTKAAYDAALENGYVQSVPNAVGSNKYYYATVSTAGDGTGTITAYEYAVTLEASANAGKMTNDGGNSTTQYEVGTDLTILTSAGTATTTAGSQHGLSWDSAGTGTTGDTAL